MKSVMLKDVPHGAFVKRKPEAKSVFTRGDYDRSYKRYALDDWFDISRAVYLKGTTIVYIDFDY
jgi:hypothetical protein